VLIPVPAPWGERLDGYRRALEGRLDVPAHITLVPPTVVADDDMQALLVSVADVARAHAPFRVRLRGTGTFRPVSPVVFVGVVEGISACESLEARLRTGPLAGERRFPYHPHVTIAHELPDATLDHAFDAYARFEAWFDVTSFSLYQGDEQGWHSVAAYPLGR
jgi:2'-5' RNA ligase